MEYFIYALLDNNSVPFYIGKTKDVSKRKKRHVYNATQLGMQLPVYNKIRKLLRQHLALDIEVVESGLSETTVDQREQFWIKDYKERGYRLFNVSEGGEGGKGFTATTIEKIRQTHLGRKRSQETCRRISESLKGKKFTQARKKKMSEVRRKRVISEETRKRASASAIGKVNIKQYKLINPTGCEYITDHGLSDFCREHKLSMTCLCRVAKGERSHHKGWRAEQLAI